jgi:hypothetical protein
MGFNAPTKRSLVVLVLIRKGSKPLTIELLADS